MEAESSTSFVKRMVARFNGDGASAASASKKAPSPANKLASTPATSTAKPTTSNVPQPTSMTATSPPTATPSLSTRRPSLTMMPAVLKHQNLSTLSVTTVPTSPTLTVSSTVAPGLPPTPGTATREKSNGSSETGAGTINSMDGSHKPISRAVSLPKLVKKTSWFAPARSSSPTSPKVPESTLSPSLAASSRLLAAVPSSSSPSRTSSTPVMKTRALSPNTSLVRKSSTASNPPDARELTLVVDQPSTGSSISSPRRSFTDVLFRRTSTNVAQVQTPTSPIAKPTPMSGILLSHLRSLAPTLHREASKTDTLLSSSSILSMSSAASSSDSLIRPTRVEEMSVQHIYDSVLSREIDQVNRSLGEDGNCMTYLEALAMDPTKQHLIKSPADVYVSYARSLRWSDLLEVLSAATEALGLEDRYVWLDVCSLHLPQAGGGLKGTGLVAELGRIMQSIGRVELVMLPLGEEFPVPLKRARCMLEAHLAVEKNLDVSVQTSPYYVEDLRRFLRSGKANLAYFQELFGEIDVLAGESLLTEDESAIADYFFACGVAESRDAVAVPLKDFLTEEGERAAETAMPGTEEASLVYRALGDLHRHFDNIVVARSWFEKSLEALKGIPGELASTATAMTHFAELLALNDAKEAESMLERAVQLQTQAKGTTNHVDVARTQVMLASLLHDHGALNEARDLIGSALEVLRSAARKALDDEPDVVSLDGIRSTSSMTSNTLVVLQDLAKALTQYGTILQDLGDLEGAAHPLREAVTIGRSVYGNTPHEDMALYHANLGLLLKSLDDLDEAQIHFEKALQIDLALFGESHLEIATDLNNLARLLHVKGKLLESKSKYEEAIAILRRSVTQLTSQGAVGGPGSELEERHLAVASALLNFGALQSDSCEYDAALETLEEVLSITVTVHGRDHPDVAAILHQIALVLHDMGLVERADVVGKEALAIVERTLGADHPWASMVSESWQAPRPLVADETGELEQ